MKKRICILTLSYKNKGFCVAGIDVGTGSFIRLVGSDIVGADEIDKSAMYYADGSPVKCFDIVEAAVLRHIPYGCQTENWLLDYSVPLVFAGKADESILAPGNDKYVICNTEKSISQMTADTLGRSLFVYRVQELTVRVFQADDGRYVNGCDFSYRGSFYRGISLTDPEYRKLSRNGEVIDEAMIVVSLPAVPLAGQTFCNKFVAKIVPVCGDTGSEPEPDAGRDEALARARAALKQVFGYDAFRAGQEDIVASIMCGRDALCVMPTGAGKSVCYQVPALLSDGITLVISPLISLMSNQVMALKQNGVAAAYFNSSLTEAQREKVLERIEEGRYKIIYVAPERLSSPRFLSVMKKQNISLVAVDEAHCISHWGQDFRPSYLKIGDFIGRLPSRPVVAAFTATATAIVRDDIAAALGLRRPRTVITGFDRANLFFAVEHEKNKNGRLLELINDRADKCGIVYCLTKKTVDELFVFLRERGYNATRYHAGLAMNERRSNQEDFLYGRKTIMVATNAFGMGIDKEDIAYVIHFNMPASIEEYYQEAGRAGRDGEKADCILLYAQKDITTNLFLIEHSEPDPQLSPEQALSACENNKRLLRMMIHYCTTADCLRSVILDYFGESRDERCDNCSNCRSDVNKLDVTEPGRIIAECVRTSGERFGVTAIVRTVHGSGDVRIAQTGLNRNPMFGKLQHVKRSVLRMIVDALIAEGVLRVVGSEYPALMLDKRAGELFGGDMRITIRDSAAGREKPERDKRSDAAGEYDEELFRALKSVRLELARAENIPAYIVFHDSTLKNMCRMLPKSERELLAVPGVGESKLNRYGARFLEAIRSHLSSRP